LCEQAGRYAQPHAIIAFDSLPRVSTRLAPGELRKGTEKIRLQDKPFQVLRLHGKSRRPFHCAEIPVHASRIFDAIGVTITWYDLNRACPTAASQQ
jgi:hypothetical protein